jgi:hypothetical protein
MRTALAATILGLLLTTGCATHNKVLVATGTVLGLEVAQNPATGMYQARLGYNRAELALVPVDPTNSYTPDVLTELRMTGLLSFDVGIYQRLAVGPNAVSQIGAAALFSKDSKGVINSNALSTLQRMRELPVLSPKNGGR